MNGKTTKKEEEFCRYYSLLGNSRQAAYLAGYKALPALSGEKLLSRQALRDRIEALSKEKEALISAKDGFRRIAFGSVADAVRLLDGERDEPEAMDLFMVSDIKMPKGGGMEIKFFDRLKALEALAALEEVSDGEGAAPFYRALESSARMLYGRQDDNDC